MNFEKNYLALDQLISPLEVYPILPHAVEGCEDGHHRRQKNLYAVVITVYIFSNYLI